MWLLLKVREMCLPLLFLLWLCLETHTQTIKREGWGNIFLWPLSVFTACLNICEHFPVPLLLTSLTQRPARQFLSVQEEAYGKLIPSASLVLLWFMYQCGFFVFFDWMTRWVCKVIKSILGLFDVPAASRGRICLVSSSCSRQTLLVIW